MVVDGLAPSSSAEQKNDLCSRPDVLSFVSASFEKAPLVSGSIKVRLQVSSDAPDTAFAVKLSEQFADGRVLLIRDDISTLSLRNGATSVLYEGTPDYPDKDRWWEIIERYGVTILYTAPTAIRTFMKWGTQEPEKHDMSSLRLLGSVGEPINPEAWVWYWQHIGGGRCPVVDTWWQTETGAIMLTTLPGAVFAKPGSTGLPFFGVDIGVVKDRGEPCGANEGGKLVVKRPWPSMARTLWGDDERYRKTYWDVIPNVYFTGDGARRDQDDYFWVVGRIDDVLNVAGHRIGTAEIESALVSHAAVAEAAAVGRPDDLKGQALVVFVTVKSGKNAGKELKEALRAHIEKEIGKFARPDSIRFTDSLPKTRSGKIMRRLLKEIAAGGETKGDTTTLEDLGVLAKLRANEEE